MVDSSNKDNRPIKYIYTIMTGGQNPPHAGHIDMPVDAEEMIRSLPENQGKRLIFMHNVSPSEDSYVGKKAKDFKSKILNTEIEITRLWFDAETRAKLAKAAIEDTGRMNVSVFEEEYNKTIFDALGMNAGFADNPEVYEAQMNASLKDHDPKDEAEHYYLAGDDLAYKMLGSYELLAKKLKAQNPPQTVRLVVFDRGTKDDENFNRADLNKKIERFKKAGGVCVYQEQPVLALSAAAAAAPSIPAVPVRETATMSSTKIMNGDIDQIKLLGFHYQMALIDSIANYTPPNDYPMDPKKLLEYKKAMLQNFAIALSENNNLDEGQKTTLYKKFEALNAILKGNPLTALDLDKAPHSVEKIKRKAEIQVQQKIDSPFYKKNREPEVSLSKAKEILEIATLAKEMKATELTILINTIREWSESPDYKKALLKDISHNLYLNKKISPAERQIIRQKITEIMPLQSIKNVQLNSASMYENDVKDFGGKSARRLKITFQNDGEQLAFKKYMLENSGLSNDQFSALFSPGANAFYIEPAAHKNEFKPKGIGTLLSGENLTLVFENEKIKNAFINAINLGGPDANWGAGNAIALTVSETPANNLKGQPLVLIPAATATQRKEETSLFSSILPGKKQVLPTTQANEDEKRAVQERVNLAKQATPITGKVKLNSATMTESDFNTSGGEDARRLKIDFQDNPDDKNSFKAQMKMAFPENLTESEREAKFKDLFTEFGSAFYIEPALSRWLNKPLGIGVNKFGDKLSVTFESEAVKNAFVKAINLGSVNANWGKGNTLNLNINQTPNNQPGKSEPLDSTAVSMQTNIIKIEAVAAYKGDSRKDLPRKDNASKISINCPPRVLKAFHDIVNNAPDLLGATYVNPYTKNVEKFPSKVEDFTALHLQILARNEHANGDGVMEVELYNNVLTENQIATLRGLVKSTTVSGLVSVVASGGFPLGTARTRKIPPQDMILVDQPGLQWQKDFRNTGGMFFYPDTKTAQQLPANYVEWQNNLYKAMYGVDRPSAPSNDSVSVSWNGVKGRLDLKQVAVGIQFEFMQALESAALQGNSELSGDQKINFRFLKAGMGFFASGLKFNDAPGKDHPMLLLSRLKGIESALSTIQAMPETERMAFLGKIKRLELPFSNDPTTPEMDKVLLSIESITKSLGLEWGGAGRIDALKDNPEGFITAVTNTADPHAMPGNEAHHGSVDASICENAGIDNLNVAYNSKAVPRPLKDMTASVQASETLSSTAPSAAAPILNKPPLERKAAKRSGMIITSAQKDDLLKQSSAFGASAPEATLPLTTNTSSPIAAPSTMQNPVSSPTAASTQQQTTSTPFRKPLPPIPVKANAAGDAALDQSKIAPVTFSNRSAAAAPPNLPESNTQAPSTSKKLGNS